MPSLPEVLRAATHELHGRAERAGVMGALLQGQLERARYVALLRNLHALYEALEARELPVASLRRTEALAADLQALHGADWDRAYSLSRAARDYVARLEHAQAPALAAHAYVRYLGDVHGGQILKAIVRRLYGLSEHGGTAFYDFGPESTLSELRASLRSSLSALTYDARDTDRAADESRWAFEQHIRLFEELAAGVA
jgi:heme oxygenase (biliverdin-producing, ferredoxin)